MTSRRSALFPVLVLLAGAACSRDQASPQAGPPAMPPTPVTLAVARAQPIADTTEYVATLKSLRSTSVQPQIDGQITEIFVKSGDHVALGAPIAQIDPRRQRAALSSEEANRAAREANVTFARQQAERSASLFSAGAISKQDLEQAQTALSTAEASLQAIQAGIEQQQVQLHYYTVTAPTSGVVGDVPARVGFQVNPQTLLTTIDENDSLELNVQVPVERAKDLKPGLPVDVLDSEGGDAVASTKIGFISPRVDEQTQSILVKATVPNPGGALRSAQYVRARVVWKTEQGLVIPVTAVLRVNGQFFAFLAEDAKGPGGQASLVARQRAIKVGAIVGDNYPVLDGLKAGDRVVVAGVQKIADGAPIAPSAPPGP
jgi:RND family efflux transporter MFP subunit